jgi:hypothetical protein
VKEEERKPKEKKKGKEKINKNRGKEINYYFLEIMICKLFDYYGLSAHCCKCLVQYIAYSVCLHNKEG